MIEPILIPTEKIITLQDFQEQKLVKIDDTIFIIEHNMVDDTLPIIDIILIDTEAKIVEGDLYYATSSDPKGIIRGGICNYDSTKHCMSSDGGKVISSTNKSLFYQNRNSQTGEDTYIVELPQLSPQSIQLLINYYNEHKCMPESVDVEMEEVKRNGYAPNIKGAYHQIIKLNPQGEIDIAIPKVKQRSIKDCVASHEGDTQYEEEKLYTGEELIQKCHLALATGSAYGGKMDQKNADSWIKTHIKKK